MATLSQRLEAVVASAELTTADLRWWFDRPYPTVRLWREGEIRRSRGPRGRVVDERLRLLEWAIANRRGFPIPGNLGLRERPVYIKKVRHDLEAAGVLNSNPA